MLEIILLILKIIGIILLAIAGIIIGIYIAVKFIPGRYRIIAKADGDVSSIKVSVKYSWMFRLVYLILKYENGVYRWKIRLLWESSEETETLFGEETKEAEEKKNEKKTRIKRAKGIEKIRCTFRELCDSIKEMLGAKSELQKFLSDDIHRTSLKTIKDELVIFLKHCQLDQSKGYLKVGLKDPYYTGLLLAFLSILYPFIGAELEVYPEFEKEILEGNFVVKGRIRLWHIIRLVGRCTDDEKIKQTYDYITQFKS